MAWTDTHASERLHSLDQNPLYAGKDLPGTHELTDWSPRGNGPKDEVYRVTSSLSFIARALIIISEDKHFEDLTGEDVLFGLVKDSLAYGETSFANAVEEPRCFLVGCRQGIEIRRRVLHRSPQV